MLCSHRIATFPGLLCSFALLLTAIPANAQSAGRVTPITTEQPPVTSDFVLLIDARQTMGLNTDMKEILEGFGLREGANSEPAEYVVEKAFVG